MSHALGILRTDIDRTLGLIGCTSTAKLNGSYLRRVPTTRRARGAEHVSTLPHAPTRDTSFA